MKNKLDDLNNYLFEQIEKLNDDDLTQEELDLAIQKADKIADISRVIIQNQALQLNAVKAAAEYGIFVPKDKMQYLLGSADNGKEI